MYFLAPDHLAALEKHFCFVIPSQNFHWSYFHQLTRRKPLVFCSWKIMNTKSWWKHRPRRTQSFTPQAQLLCWTSCARAQSAKRRLLNCTTPWAPFPAVSQYRRLRPITGQHVAETDPHMTSPPRCVSHTGTETSGKIWNFFYLHK